MYLAKNTPQEIIARFDNLSDYVATARKGTWYLSDRCRFGNNPHPVSWAGGMLDESLNAIQAGTKTSPTIRRRAKELMDKIDSSFRDRETSAWMPSVAGAYPVVPEFLVGMPENMRIRRPVESDIAPVRVYVETAYSAGTNETAIINAGTALAALIMRLSEERPVEVSVFTAWRMRQQSGRHILWSMPLDAHPINLSQVLDTVACKAFARTCNFNVVDAIQREAGYPGMDNRETCDWAYGYNNKDRVENLKRAFGLGPSDVLTEGGKLMDQQLLNRDPVEWVHRQLEKFRTIQE